VVEGFAQTAGILTGEAGDFKEKVILAKVGKAEFQRYARPGDVLRFEATLDTFGESGASTSGEVFVNDQPMAILSMMFSHAGQAMAHLGLPEHNFVFTGEFMALLDAFRHGASQRELA
jgi:3-hydroxyacyl-[acyl-carrier-protein] dehydratase